MRKLSILFATFSFLVAVSWGDGPIIPPGVSQTDFDTLNASVSNMTSRYCALGITNGSTTNNLAIADTYYKKTGWTVGNSGTMTCTSSNITVVADGNYLVTYFTSISGGSNKEIKTAIFTNGVIVAVNGEWKRKIGTGGDVGSASAGAIIPLVAGDVIDLRMKCVGDTANIVIEEADFLVTGIGSVTATDGIYAPISAVATNAAQDVLIAANVTQADFDATNAVVTAALDTKAGVIDQIFTVTTPTVSSTNYNPNTDYVEVPCIAIAGYSGGLLGQSITSINPYFHGELLPNNSDRLIYSCPEGMTSVRVSLYINPAGAASTNGVNIALAVLALDASGNYDSETIMTATALCSTNKTTVYTKTLSVGITPSTSKKLMITTSAGSFSNSVPVYVTSVYGLVPMDISANYATWMLEAGAVAE